VSRTIAEIESEHEAKGFPKRTDEPPESTAVLPELKKDATVWELATIIAGSRDFPSARTPEKAAVRILAGREMGVGPVASVIGIRVENGRVSMDATLMAGCIKRSERYDYRLAIHTEAETVIEFFERTLSNQREMVGESRFSWEDAVKAGLNKKDTWRSYPRNMLFARALSNGARWYCPGIFGGSVYTHEEIGLPTDSEGQIADSSAANNGSDLCTKDQRGEIRSLLAQIGTTEADYCRGQGIKMLDELSSNEAAKALKGLAKQAAKKATTGKTGDTNHPSETMKTATTGPVAAPSPAVVTMQESFIESNEPSIPQQHQQIFDLADAITGGNQVEARALLVAVLEKRGIQKYRDLSHLQAAALIENMERKVAVIQATVPFDPTPVPAGS
jgi:hypothetical protein